MGDHAALWKSLEDGESKSGGGGVTSQNLQMLTDYLEKEKKTFEEDESRGDLSEVDAASSVSKNQLGLVTHRVLKGHFGKVYALHWGTQKNLVTASQDGKLIIWDGESTNKENAIPLRSSWVMTCAYEREKQEFVACGGLDNLCSVYKLDAAADGTSKAQATELANHDGYLSCCRFVDSDKILTSSGDSTCNLYNISTKAVIRTFEAHTADVMCVSLDEQNSNLFASGSCDSTLKVWDMRDNGHAGGVVMSFGGHESDINSVCHFNNGHTIGTGSDDSSCKIFDMRSYCSLKSLAHEQILCGITSVVATKTNRFLIAGYDDHHCYAWNVVHGTKEELKSKDGNAAHENRVSCLGMNAGNASALATGSWDTNIKIYG